MRSLCVGWVGCLWSLCGGWDLIGIRPLRCSIRQDRPCKILLRIQDGAECGKRSEIELLFALRTRTVRDIKANFPTQYGSSLTCELCQVAVYCQENLLSCIRLNNIRIFQAMIVMQTYLTTQTDKQSFQEFTKNERNSFYICFTSKDRTNQV